jgi:DeoR family transcriptional regulator, suf operon transcriptional repressor
MMRRISEGEMMGQSDADIMLQKRTIGNPAGSLLTLLQRKGALTVKEMEEGLGVTANAVRQQIGNLLADGYIEQETERNGRGRPRHVYSLTVKGRALFPHHYDEFTNSLLREILMTEGPQKVQLLLNRMSRRMAEQYASRIASQAPADRAQELIELLNAKGILADLQVGADGILVEEYNCPYYELARQYRAICDMELGMLSEVVRQRVELVSCSLDGHHGCRFKIGTDGVDPILEATQASAQGE